MKIDDNIIQMTARTAASVPTPSAGIVYQFLDTATGHYSQKDSAGTVTDLAAAGGGGGSPAGTTKEVQFNNAGAFAGAANVEIDNGDLTLVNNATPVAPPAGQIKIFSQLDGGATKPKYMSPDGTIDTLFSAPHENSSAVLFTPSSGTTGTGFGFGASWSSGGTVTHATPAATNQGTSMPRTRWTNVATTTNQTLGVVGNVPARFWRGNAAGIGGFLFFSRFGIELIPAATVRLVVGVATLNTIGAADTITGDAVALWHDTTDALTTLNILTRDNVTSTKTALTVPALAAGQFFEFSLYCPPNGTQVFYKLVNYLTKAVIAEGSVTATLPRNDQFMLPVCRMSNGTANITVTTTMVSLNTLYARTLT